ncbi:hypothetical protein WHR41_05396 [Cladosporium halotolerans]|uniref:Uncharacterized protein n=1 Tax=Cladosporium halotolerans TaxID=1052096 RepID=A0AB34KM89_9PEZI
MASGKRTSLPRTGEHEFPALFTIDGSARHEILLINPGLSLADLTTQIESLLSSSPNAQEFMGKYRGKDVREAVREVTVKWAAEGRDSRVWVRETLLTEENVEAVLRMMAVGVGRDVFDVKVKVVETKGEEGKGEGKKK